MANPRKHAEIAESSLDKTSKAMLAVMLAIVIAGILAFLLLQPRPSGSRQGHNPMRASLSADRVEAVCLDSAAG